MVARRVTHPPAPEVEPLPRLQLLVLAPDPAGAVRSAGGWVFDRVTAGWEATVLVGGLGDTRPLRILGARAGRLTTDLNRSHLTAPDALAVDAALWRRDAAVRSLLDRAVKAGLTDLRFFGDVAGHEERLTPAGHRLSIAAVAFKAHALAVVIGAHETSGGTETFGVRR